MALKIPPPSRIAIGTATIGGQQVEIRLNPEWARYFESLTTLSNVTAAAVGLPGAPGTTGAAGVGVSLSEDPGGSVEFIPGPPGPTGPQGAPGLPIGLLMDDSGGSVEFMPGTSGDITNSTGSPTLTAPNIGTATGTSLALTAGLTSSGGGIGYATGAGGVVAQATSKSTGVTLNKLCGQINMNGASLAADTSVSFTFTNSFIGAFDLIATNLIAGSANPACYTINAAASAGAATITVRNNTAGALAEGIAILFAVVKVVES